MGKKNKKASRSLAVCKKGNRMSGKAPCASIVLNSEGLKRKSHNPRERNENGLLTRGKMFKAGTKVETGESSGRIYEKLKRDGQMKLLGPWRQNRKKNRNWFTGGIGE